MSSDSKSSPGGFGKFFGDPGFRWMVALLIAVAALTSIWVSTRDESPTRVETTAESKKDQDANRSGNVPVASSSDPNLHSSRGGAIGTTSPVIFEDRWNSCSSKQINPVRLQEFLPPAGARGRLSEIQANYCEAENLRIQGSQSAARSPCERGMTVAMRQDWGSRCAGGNYEAALNVSDRARANADRFAYEYLKDGTKRFK